MALLISMELLMSKLGAEVVVGCLNTGTASAWGLLSGCCAGGSGATADESPSRTTSASSQRSKSSSTCKGKPKLSRRAQSANALSKSQLDTWRASGTRAPPAHRLLM